MATTSSRTIKAPSRTPVPANPAFQLGGLLKETLQSLRPVTWAFALSFVVITFLTWRYFFIAPLVLSGLVALCLALADWNTARA